MWSAIVSWLNCGVWGWLIMCHSNVNILLFLIATPTYYTAVSAGYVSWCPCLACEPEFTSDVPKFLWTACRALPLTLTDSNMGFNISTLKRKANIQPRFIQTVPCRSVVIDTLPGNLYHSDIQVWCMQHGTLMRSGYHYSSPRRHISCVSSQFNASSNYPYPVIHTQAWRLDHNII